MAEPPALDPDLAHELERMADALAARDDHADLARRFEWLIDTLIFRGQIPASFRRLVARVDAGERSIVRLATFRDKYAVESADIDCAARIPLCRARCCSFDVTLSAQDVAEGGIPFDLHRPYAMPRRDDGGCVCKGDDGACTIYARRPGACRAYDCRHDPRVWIDFEQRIPAP